MGVRNAAIGLVMCNRNRSQFLAQAIESVLNQTFNDWNLIIWDDASGDRSRNIIEQYNDPRITKVFGTYRTFPACQRHALFSLNTPYLGIVDSDDRLLPTCLEETHDYLDHHDGCDMVYTHHYEIDETGDRLGIGQRCSIKYDRDKILKQHMVFHFRLFRKTAHDAIGGINANQRMAVDWDFNIRFSRDREIQCLPVPLYEYRKHLGSMTMSNPNEQNRWARMAISKHTP